MDARSATTTVARHFLETTLQNSAARRHHGSMVTSHAPSRCHYISMSSSASGVVRASALRWVPYAAAVSTVRGLLGATHGDLALRMPLLSRALRTTFFFSDAAAEQRMVPPFSATSRFPEQELFVCADLSPVGPALQAVNQAMTQVVVKAASAEACACYYDAVGKLMRLLVDKGYGLGQVLFNRATFESEFVLLWAPL